MDSNCVLEMREISKRFAGVHALDNVSFFAYDSKVNVLIGENGAGKSTLMKILAGALKKDSGLIKIYGEEVEINRPVDSIKLRIAMIYQELNLVQDMTVAENIFLGREPGSKGFIERKKQIKTTKELLDSLEIDIDPKALVASLSMAKQQLVEIAKALSLDARIIVMDEPTSSLTEHEVTQLFKIIRRLNDEGVTVIYISHRLDEIFEIGDYVTVLRDGIRIGEWPISEIGREELIAQMVGREITQLFPKEKVEIGEEVLRVNSLTKWGKFRDVSFGLKKGEILGISGLVGAGRTEVANAIFGYDPPDKGEVWVNGKHANIKNPVDAIKLRVGFVPEDRKKLGLNLISTVGRNISITIMDKITLLGFIKFQVESSLCNRMVDKLSIKTPSLNQLAKNLSGGNQQKIVLAKWIAREVDVLILDEPTRGVDVGAKSEIHKLIVELAKQGVGIILISSELPEVIGMADRVIVMHEGVVTAILNASEATQERIMMHATGTNERVMN